MSKKAQTPSSPPVLKRNALVIVCAAIAVVAIGFGIRTLLTPAPPPAQRKQIQKQTPSSEPRPKRSEPMLAKVTPTAAAQPTRAVRYEIGSRQAFDSSRATKKGFFVTTNTIAETPESTLTIQQQVADLESLFRSEKDPQVRGDIAYKMGERKDPETVRLLLKLLQTEQNPEVRSEILRALSWTGARNELSADILAAVKPAYEATKDVQQHVEIQNVAGEIESPESISFLRDIYKDTNADPEERLNAAECMLRLHTLNDTLLSADEAKAIGQQVRLDAEAGATPELRSQALMALAQLGNDSLDFFKQRASAERDPMVLQLLQKLIRMGETTSKFRPSGTKQ